MKKISPAIDSIGIPRFFHLHCFVHIYRIFFASDASNYLFEKKVNVSPLQGFNFLDP